ncbi:MAG: fused MFS/spermidine synthase [Sedimentisphaerales bacterium]|nr:fused MFS/spermidine synthase [Sedimentisphaerales bacterium]
MNPEPCINNDESPFVAPLALPGGALFVLPSHCLALFLGAFLLFAIQPMFTKMILPLLGGTPAVWNTAVMFFQAMLLGGYLYAHLLSRIDRVQWQVLVHALVLVIGLLFLPVRLAWPQAPPGMMHPAAWLIALLAFSIGVPFFAVSATAPLLQRWFSRSGHPHASDPYFLYVSSNIGGMAALLTYPVLIEPWLGLSLQSRTWTAGYAVLSVIIVLCAISLRALRRPDDRADVRASGPVEAVAALSDEIAWHTRGRWLVLSFVPSALLLAVTLHISTDVASAPFLWVVPLSLYMLTFILVFARRPILKHKWMLLIQIPLYALLAVSFTKLDLLPLFALDMAVLFVTAMVCHGELVRLRPAASRLTEFYLWMSLGGLLGGVFCVLVAPRLFSSVLEYPLILSVACLVRPGATGGGWRRSLLDGVLPAAVVLSYSFVQGMLDSEIVGPIMLYIGVTVAFFLFRHRPLRLALGFAPILFGTIFLADDASHRLLRQRSFFGVYTVCKDPSGNVHSLHHGNIVHGDQHLDEETVRTPTSYYNRQGPLGQVFEAMRMVRPLKHVGCVGLGAGTTACYQEPRQAMTFFEVDPVMERIARDPKLFRYLEVAEPNVSVVLGDGRQSIGRVADGTFDLITLDAFSSDAIPVHMLTREALALYMRKLAPGGLVLFHISNRYVNLEPVLANLTMDAGLAALVEDYEPSAEAGVYGWRSSWVAVARDAGDLALLNEEDGWRPLKPDVSVGLWTDDYSNLFRTLIWEEMLPWR